MINTNPRAIDNLLSLQGKRQQLIINDLDNQEQESKTMISAALDENQTKI